MLLIDDPLSSDGVVDKIISTQEKAAFGLKELKTVVKNPEGDIRIVASNLLFNEIL